MYKNGDIFDIVSVSRILKYILCEIDRYLILLIFGSMSIKVDFLRI